MDFKIAAHGAIVEVFPEWNIQACYFHFINAIKKQAKKKGVRKRVRQTDEYNEWIGHIFGSVFLETDAARQTFTHLLNNPPAIDNADLVPFIRYLRSFWLPKLDKVCTWNDRNPRTNNPAEAYHSKLRRAFQHEPHPQVGVAFDVYAGHLSSAAIEFLRFGNDVGKLQTRTKKQREKDRKLMEAKDKLVEFANSLGADQDVPISHLLK